jgi:hypothetical protein
MATARVEMARYFFTTTSPLIVQTPLPGGRAYALYGGPVA